MSWRQDTAPVGARPPPEDTSRAAYDARQSELAWRTAQAQDGPAAALPWLERAARFTTADENLRFSIATARLAAGDAAGAHALFAAMAEKFAVREVWAGLCASALALGRTEAALAALTHLLRHFSPDTAVLNLASRLSPASSRPGWCALQAGGMVSVSCPGAVTVRFGQTNVPFRRAFPLPKHWRAAEDIHVLVDGQELLGSPMCGRAIGRVEGFVERVPGGVRGWAWHPAAPEADPLLLLQSPGGNIPLTATDLSEPVTAAIPLNRPRAFTQRLDLTRRWRISGADGRDLLGSPLGGPAVIPAAPEATGLPGTAVIIPVHRDVAATLACLASVLATIAADDTVVVVADGVAPDMRAGLDGLPADPRLCVVPSFPPDPGRALGFPRAANCGLGLTGGRDAVLLNSDTLVFPGWLETLRHACHSAGDIASATPLSNNASIFSYPAPDAPGPMPDAAEGARLAALALVANAGLVVDVPTGNGFCLYLRADALQHTGLLREDCFGQGYGEENDWTERAAAGGYRHIAVPSVFVAHQGGASFPAAGGRLLARNAAILADLHPGYHARVAAWNAADKLRPARARLAAAQLHDAANPAGAVLLVTHAGQGGTARMVTERARAIQAAGKRALKLTARGGVATLAEADPPPGSTAELHFTLPADAAALTGALAREGTDLAEIHHLMGHDDSLPALLAGAGIAHEVWVHDYAWLCPRISFTNGAGQFCGEAEPPVCAACVAEWGHAPGLTPDAAALRARSAAVLRAARRVVAPAADVATRLRRHVRDVQPVISPWEAEPAPPPALARATGEVVVAVTGAISLEKGYNLLLACAEDAAQNKLKLRFHVIGHTEDDEPLLRTGSCFVTGRYAPAEAARLIAQSGAQFGFLPSIWPETWCFALTDMLAAGLRVAAFNIGTPAERLTALQAGWLLPLGLPAGRVNEVLLRIGRGG